MNIIEIKYLSGFSFWSFFNKLQCTCFTGKAYECVGLHWLIYLYQCILGKLDFELHSKRKI
jgi:hypothetical protein